MRLLDTRTGEFRWIEDPRQTRYAILSHVWAQKGDRDYVPEQTYQDVRRMQDSVGQNERVLPLLSEKIRMFCEAARNDGFELGWADSCCIDKASSSELSEAINSMYNWYRYAGACYAVLQDVEDGAELQVRNEQFRGSKWFRRGWTLQELLAPSVVLFLSDKWNIIGSKHTLASLVESVTGIERRVLTLEQPLEEVSVARRMSWAATRETTREEDEAYSLMGIFGVNMPTTYGEGRHAFIRLQEEILKHIPDQTIFAWGPLLSHHNFSFSHPSSFTPSPASDLSPIPIAPSSKQYLLASSPKDFKSSSQMLHIPREAFAERLGISPEDAYHLYTTTSYGIHARFPLVTVMSQDAHANVPTHLALLACEDSQGRLLALLLRPHSGTEYFVGTIVGRVSDLMGSDAPFSTISTLYSHYYRATYLSLQSVDYCRRRRFVEPTSVYIPHRPSHTANGLERDTQSHTMLREARDAFEVRLSGWSRKILASQGYRVSPGLDNNVALRDRVLSRTLSSSASGLVISNSAEYITIQVGRCNCELATRFGLLGVLVSSRNATCALDDQFAEEPHFIGHPVHVHSWAFRCGVASKEVTLRSHTRERVTVRLTFTHGASQTPHIRSYRLGVEIWSSTDVAVNDVELDAPGRRRGDKEHMLLSRRATHHPISHAPTHLAPADLPPGMERARSSSDPSLPPWLDDDPHQGDLPEGIVIHEVQQVSHTPEDSPLYPSPPVSSSESPAQNHLLDSGHGSRAPPRDPPASSARQKPYGPYAEDVSRRQMYATTRLMAPPGAQRTTRRASTEAHPDARQLTRQISMEIGPSQSRFNELDWVNSPYVKSEDPLPGRQPEHVRQPLRSGSDEVAGRYTTRREGFNNARTRENDGHRLSNWPKPAQENPSRLAPALLRCASPEPLSSSDEPEESEIEERRRDPAVNAHTYPARARSPARPAAAGSATVGLTGALHAQQPRRTGHRSTRSVVYDRTRNSFDRSPERQDAPLHELRTHEQLANMGDVDSRRPNLQLQSPDGPAARPVETSGPLKPQVMIQKRDVRPRETSRDASLRPGTSLENARNRDRAKVQTDVPTRPLGTTSRKGASPSSPVSLASLREPAQPRKEKKKRGWQLPHLGWGKGK